MPRLTPIISSNRRSVSRTRAMLYRNTGRGPAAGDPGRRGGIKEAIGVHANLIFIPTIIIMLCGDPVAISLVSKLLGEIRTLLDVREAYPPLQVPLLRRHPMTRSPLSPLQTLTLKTSQRSERKLITSKTLTIGTA